MPQWISRHLAKTDFSKFDVIMTSSGMAYPLFKRLYLLKDRPVLVNHIHGLSVYDHIANLSESELGYCKTSWLYRLVTGPFQKKWDSEGIRWSDLTITQNMRDLGWVEDNYKQSPKTILIPGAVHTDLLEASELWRPLKTRNPSRILWFASWEARKGSFYVPGVFREVRRKRPDATLVIGGSGKAPQDLLNAFAPEDRDAVQVLGHISITEQIKLLNECSIFLFPSISEGFGLALPEAMCFGLAAVTTQTAFGGDYLVDDKNAKIVFPSRHYISRALLDLIENDELRHRIGTAGRDLARAFTAERLLTNYEKAFTEILCDHSSEMTPERPEPVNV
jgi:glycosyltransferase involved in cell wall biosynthesis